MSATWEDVCIDLDGDDHGFQCEQGEDCDDSDPALFEGCSKCRKPADGCACAADAKPVDCSLPLSVDKAGSLICRSGTRYCRDGRWSACEGVATYSVAASEVRAVNRNALVDPDAPLVRCDGCHPGCYRIEDRMVTPAGYTLPSGLEAASGGGVSLSGYSVADAGMLDDRPCAADDQPDCDGVPTRFDSDPDAGAPRAQHRTLFMDLPPGSSSSQRLSAQVFLSSADIYFYMDGTSTMRDELLRLVSDFSAGNFLPDAGADIDCVDSDFDGAPDELKKQQGIAGNIACLVRDARFGAGWFRDIPFYGPFADTRQEVAPWDTEMFEHRHDISPDVNSVALALSGFTSRANNNVPEGGMQGLWALATGGEIYAGWGRPGVPARAGCARGTFGYPCFRADALPVIVHFTDAPMQEGPPTRARPTTSPATPANCMSDAEYGDNGQTVCEALHYDSAVLSGMASGSDGRYQPLRSSAEDRANAQQVGAIDQGLVTYVGNSERMTTDIDYDTFGPFRCPLGTNAWSPVDQRSPDAVFVFHVDARERYLISGRGTRFDATFMLFALDAAGAPTEVVACADTDVHLNEGDELDYAPEIERDLDPGDYLLVLKGYRNAARGMFQVSFGRRNQETIGRFVPKAWLGPLGDGVDGVEQALTSRDIRVVTVQSGRDPYAREQSLAIASATGALANEQPLLGQVDDLSMLAGEVVRVVRELALGTIMDVSLSLVATAPAPTPPFGLRVEALETLNSGCNGVVDSDRDGLGDMHLDCMAQARPAFNVTFSNGTGAAAVPPNAADPNGGYQLTLQVLGDGRYLLDQIPVYLVPSDLIPDPPPLPRSASGSYEQTIVASGCTAGEGASWLTLAFEAGVPEGTELAFDFCGGETDAELSACTPIPVATITRGGSCREQNDCGRDGYCDPSGFCHLVRGTLCDSDEQCGSFGTCNVVDTVARCTYAHNAVDLRQSAPQASGLPRARVRARLSANADRTQSPTLLRWNVDYSCAPLE